MKKSKILLGFYAMFLISVFTFGTYSIMSGIHSIDLAWNSYKNSRLIVDFANEQLKLENSSTTISIEKQTDLGSDFKERSLENVYIGGFNKLITGLGICFIFLFLIGYFLGSNFS